VRVQGAQGDVGAKGNKNKREPRHGVRKGVDWGHVKASEIVRKLGDTEASVARFLRMTTASVNQMARPEEMTKLDAYDN